MGTRRNQANVRNTQVVCCLLSKEKGLMLLLNGLEGAFEGVLILTERKHTLRKLSLNLFLKSLMWFIFRFVS
jgi:hypothetical protein